MKKSIVLTALFAAAILVSCKENKAEEPKHTIPVSSTPSTPASDETMSIPMHGTKENSSSSTNGSFQMDEDMKKSIQAQKAE